MMPFICIQNEDDAEKPSILFPVEGELTKSDLQTAFPNATSLRYKNSETGQIHHILCRNGVFVEPDEGWGKEERIYSIVCDQTVSDSRTSLFDTYRRQLSNRNRRSLTSSSSPNKKKSEKQKTAMIHVGIGSFRNDRFMKISAHHLSGIGGQVVVGPFLTTTNTTVTILAAAFEKFHCLNRSFRRKFNSSDQLRLVYNDGTIVDKLPDKSAEFSLEGYRNLIDPKLKFDRLRFYLCDKAEVDIHNESIEIVTDSNSSSDELPELSFTRQRERNEQSSDDTLPLTIEVTFSLGLAEICKESFPNNSTISVLLTYLHDQRHFGSEGEEVTLKFQNRTLDIDERLMDIHNAPAIRMNIEINKTSSEESLFAENDRRIVIPMPIPGNFNDETAAADAIVKKTVNEMSSRCEPETIMKCFRNNFLLGRTLDVVDVSSVPSGETSCIFVGRNNVLMDTVNEILAQNNLRYPLEVNFYGEESEDFGGPRKEYFRIVIKAIKEQLCNEDGTLFSKEAMIANKVYYVAAIVLGLSAIQGGPFSSIVTRNVGDDVNDEANDQFRQGLERVGILQLLKQKKTVEILFSRTSTALTVHNLISLLKPSFSEEGTTKRTAEERSYSLFVKYIRNVAAGRQQGITLGRILAFITGSEEEPLLGFSMDPGITFSELPGYLPRATTCINMLNLPILPNVIVENEIMDKFDLAFCSEYFGLR